MRYLFTAAISLIISNTIAQYQPIAKSPFDAVKKVIIRTFGQTMANKINFKDGFHDQVNPAFSFVAENNQLQLTANSPVAMCRGFYDYIKSTNQGMFCWSGKNLNGNGILKNAIATKVESPYQFHYYMNAVTHAYSTPYWNWSRWEKELDWMALHGMDMLLINNAYEAIMFRVYKKLGLKDEVINKFFVGPAYQPFNRMGCITGWDGPAPALWYSNQITLTHKVLKRMKELQMKPVIQSFAGFVPKEITEVYPQGNISELLWNENFPKDKRCHILKSDPASAALFIKIGKLFVQEWEKEFGKGEYYLADSFNEMKVPRTANETEDQFQQQLAAYGDVVYQSIQQANKDATWVMQGWTFGYQREDWSPERLHSLISKVPDDKLLILDLANEYNIDYWKNIPSWKYYSGFFHKKWLYSFIPNMGGKTAWNGILKTYAEAPLTALQYADKGNLVGFGFAPEGIENNELIYELLSDVGWRSTKIELEDWIENYCIQRYGSYPKKMREAYQLFLQSCYGTFTDHPRFAYQIGDNLLSGGSVNKSPEFFEGVKLFLDCADDFKQSVLFKNDAIELSAQYVSLLADSLVRSTLQLQGEEKKSALNKAYTFLEFADRLLLSHPNNNLQRWINFAAESGSNTKEKEYYTQDARRIITTWGPGVNDYAAKMWSGLISSYYLPRLKMAMENKSKAEIATWQEGWIKTGTMHNVIPYSDPLKQAKKIINAD